MKRILISGYHGFGNCGDEAILVAMVKNFKKMNQSLEIVALSKEPQETMKKYGIKSVNRLNIISIIFNLLRSNMLISGGGSLLQDVTSTRSIIYYLSIIFIAKLLNKPVFVYANGIGPINKTFNRRLTSYIVNKVDVITLRDSESKKELSDLNIIYPKIMVTADPVFTLDPISKEDSLDVLQLNEISSSKPLVGISVRSWNTNSNYEHVIAEMSDEIIAKYGFNIVFIPMHPAKDNKTIENIQKLMKNDTFILHKKLNIEDYLGLISNLEVLISMRLHPLIFAAVQNIPMIGITYDPKVTSFLSLVNQPSIGDIDNINTNKLFELLENILKNRENLCEELKTHVSVLKGNAIKNDKFVLDFLSGANSFKGDI